MNSLIWNDASKEGSHNLYFEFNTTDTKPVYDVTKLIATYTGKTLIGASDNTFPIADITAYGCNAPNKEFNYKGIQYLASKDENAVYLLLINKHLEDNITIDIDIQGEYTATLHTIKSTGGIHDNSESVVTNLSSIQDISLPHLSVNVLQLTSNTCQDYTITTNTTFDPIAMPGPYGKVVVNNGATLTIDAGHEARFCTEGSLDILSNSQVDLHGTLTADDVHWKGVIVRGLSDPGRFNGFSTGVIEKADIGIQTQPDGPVNYSISTINCDRTSFINNEYGLNLSWGSHAATFTQCTFRNTPTFNHPNRFNAFCKLSFTQGIKFEGCRFTDERGDAYWGRGIQAHDAGFEVVSDGLVISKFSRLTTAVSVDNIFFSPPAIVNESQFDFCGVGVGNIGVTGLDITQNRFNFSSEYVPAGGGWFNQYQYGVLMSSGVESFVLEDNDFDLITCSGGPCRKIGVQLSYLGTSPNVVRGNRFKGNVFANHAIGENGFLPDGVGLLYECNAMTHNEVDFLTSHDPVIKIEQGRFDFDQQNFIPTQNTFVANGTYSWDFYHGLQSNVPDVDYYHRSEIVEIPNHFSGIVLKATGLYNSGCAEFTVKPGKGLTELERKENLKMYEESQLAYETVKTEMKAAQEVGDDVLFKQKRNETSYFATQKWKYANIGYMASLYDENGENRNEIRKWIRRFGTFEGDLMLASDFAGTQEWASVQNTLDMLALKYELSESDYQEIRDYESIFYILSRESVTDLSVTSQEWLDDLAESGIGYASGKARSIMGLYGKLYQPLVAEGLEKGEDEENGKEEETTKMLVSPNPADYYMTFDWSDFIISSDQQVKIEITNKMGALVQVLQPTVGQTVLEWTTNLVPSGISYYRLLIDGEEVDSGQLFINK